MIYDGWIVVMNAKGGMNMMFFRTSEARDRFLNLPEVRLTEDAPLVHGFMFADPANVSLVD